MARIGVLGAGAWGTALAIQAARAGHEVMLVGRGAERMAAINLARENTAYLPNAPLSDAIRVTANPAELFETVGVLVVTPAQHMRANLTALADHWPETLPAILCSKGIEATTGALMTEVAAEALPGRALAVLSGPTFAREVADGLPSAVTIASENAALAGKMADLLGTERFRPYIGTDIVGVEVAGAVKNVLAIASGILAGLALGHNARAALITRGLAEITRLAMAKGGRPETLLGLAGVGDLALTCTATLSRNYSFGFEMGKGKSASEILSSRSAVTEGVYTAASVLELADRLGVDMPISAAVDSVANRGADIHRVIDELLSRPLKHE